MRDKGTHKVADTLAERREFLSIVIIAIVLAIGTNLLASWISSSAPDRQAHSLWLGILLTSLPLVYLALRLVASRHISHLVEAVFILDPDENQLVPVPRYKFSEDLCRTLQAAFLENEALEAAWKAEPLSISLSSGNDESNDPNPTDRDSGSDTVTKKEDTPRSSYIAIVRQRKSETTTRPRSAIILQEAVEFVILDELSTHLSGYFQNLPENDKLVTEYTRKDVPNLLLENRIVSLLTTPLEDRAVFLECSFADNPPPGEIESIIGSDGSMYSRFNLTLPKDTKVSRPAPGVVKLENSRLVLELAVHYEGFSANLPMGFEESFLGRSFGRLEPHLVHIRFAANIKLPALLQASGWEYHKWVDSFAKSLEEFASFDEFIEHIGWRIVATQLRAMRIDSRHQPKIPTDANKQRADKSAAG